VITQLGERVGRGCRSLGEDSDRMMRLKERLERFGNSHDAEGWVTECADLMEVISEEKERWPQFETKLAPYKVRGKKAAKSFGRKGDQVYFNGIGWKAKAPRPRNYPQGRLHH
jgi:hypothetical protein